jgi:hypothetical protein
VIERWLARFRYHDWRFSLWTHDEGTVLRIEFTVPDSRNPGELQDQRVHTFVPPYRTEDDFRTWLRWRLGRIAIHEVNEFLLEDGKLVNDPHRTFEEQLRPYSG